MLLPNMHKKVSKNLNRAQHISVMSDISVTVIYRAVSDYTVRAIFLDRLFSYSSLLCLLLDFGTLFVVDIGLIQ
jgi:hypothetical protein